MTGLLGTGIINVRMCAGHSICSLFDTTQAEGVRDAPSPTLTKYDAPSMFKSDVVLRQSSNQKI